MVGDLFVTQEYLWKIVSTGLNKVRHAYLAQHIHPGMSFICDEKLNVILYIEINVT